MNFQQTLDFLYSKLPMFTRVGAAAFKKDLNNIIALCDHLGNPHHQFKSIHVGGTNGKGSTTHMLASILQKAGYKTGLYTSPHLKDFRERIRINGKMVPKSFVIDFVKKEKQIIAEIEPSFFEVTVGMAFSYFAQEKVDIAIIEVGLGGRLDSTNIISPELSVITNISLDHTNLLGETLPEIAFEKAGIIKENTPVVIGEMQKETSNVFTTKASTQQAPILFADTQLCVKNVKQTQHFLSVDIFNGTQLSYANLKLDLTGGHQEKNILTVIQAILCLKAQNFKISDEAVFEGLKAVKKNTGLQGRWQTLQRKPLIICDTGHNKAGITEVLSNIERTNYQHLHMVIGMVKDKDISGVLALLPKNARYYFCQPQLERALSATDLAKQAKSFNLIGKTFPSVNEALQSAKLNAIDKDLIFIGGSTFVVAEIL